MKSGHFLFAFFTATFINLQIFNSKAFAHCDALDGPVVKAAQAALQNANINLVLPWVKPEDESQIKKAFNQTLEVRKMSSSAKELADQYFFETVVRIHRACEGAPFSGLKPAGQDLGPAIPAAEKAIEENSTKDLERLIVDAVRLGIDNNFNTLMKVKNYNKDDISAGRTYVEHYVTWIHYISALYDSAQKKPIIHEQQHTPNHDSNLIQH